MQVNKNKIADCLNTICTHYFLSEEDFAIFFFTSYYTIMLTGEEIFITHNREVKTYQSIEDAIYFIREHLKYNNI